MTMMEALIDGFQTKKSWNQTFTICKQMTIMQKPRTSYLNVELAAVIFIC